MVSASEPLRPCHYIIKDTITDCIKKLTRMALNFINFTQTNQSSCDPFKQWCHTMQTLDDDVVLSSYTYQGKGPGHSNILLKPQTSVTFHRGRPSIGRHASVFAFTADPLYGRPRYTCVRLRTCMSVDTRKESRIVGHA